MKKIKQGHTKFHVVIYEPGKIDGYDDCYVASVFTCFVTGVLGDTVYFRTERQDGYESRYMCGKNFWNDKLFSNRRKALREAQRRIDEIDKAYEEA